MLAAPVSRAQYLEQAQLQTIAVDAHTQAAFGADAADLKIASPLTVDTDAATEAARQLAYLARPRASDTAVIEGVWTDLEGETVAIAYDGHLGVSGLVSMLVIRSHPDLATGTTELQGEVLL